MFANYCQFEDAKTDWILACAHEFKDDLSWRGLDLRPSFIRYLTIALGSADQNWVKQKLASDTSSHCILHGLKKSRSSLKSMISRIPCLLHLLYKISWLGYQPEKITKRRPLIVVHHWKFANFLKQTQLFDDLNPLWLVDTPKKARNLGLREGDLIVPHTRPCRRSKRSFPLNLLDDLANGLEASLLSVNPSAVFVVEGDATEHALLAEIGRKHNIPIYCFQWGIFHHNKLKTAFSEMRFNKFLVWGKIFEEQLKIFNPQLEFVSFGHPLFSGQLRYGDGIIFLSQGIGEFVERKDQISLINLAVSLAKIFPNRVMWRPHPNNPIDSFELEMLRGGNVLLLDPKLPLSDQLQDSILAIGIGSSSLIDALAFGVIPVSFNTTCLPMFPFPLQERNIGFVYRDLEVALREIELLLNDDIQLREIQNNIYESYELIFEKLEKNIRQDYIRSICIDKNIKK